MEQSANKRSSQGTPGGYRPNHAPHALRVVSGNGNDMTEPAQMAERITSASLISGVSHINLPVGSDLGAAADWYVRVFGLPGCTAADRDRCVLQLPSGREQIVLWRMDRTLSGVSMELKGKTQPFLVVNVKAVDSIFARLTAAGGECVMPPCDLFFRTAVFKDPFGNGITVIQEPAGWSKQIGRNGDANTLDWVKIPVHGTAEQLVSAAQWYKANLGLEIGELNQEQDGIDLQPGNLHLQLDESNTKAHFVRDGEIVPLFCLHTPDLHALCRKLTENGVAVKLHQASGDSSAFLTMTDPSGNCIGIAEGRLVTSTR